MGRGQQRLKVPPPPQKKKRDTVKEYFNPIRLGLKQIKKVIFLNPQEALAAEQERWSVIVKIIKF